MSQKRQNWSLTRSVQLQSVIDTVVTDLMVGGKHETTRGGTSYYGYVRGELGNNWVRKRWRHQLEERNSHYFNW
jgi:hypothetical protein